MAADEVFVQSRPDNLALQFQGVFTAIVRIQSGRQQLRDTDSFRRRMRQALEEAERDAIAARYSTDDFSNGQMAVVALLDEAILSSNDPGREEWRRQTLNVQLYGEANAGEVFFDRLQALVRREESSRLADVLEVYLLCLLLGFEGKYGGAMRGESLVLAGRVRARIEAIRGLDYQISPRLELATAAEAQVPGRSAPVELARWAKWAAATALALIALFVVYKLHLLWRLGQLQTLTS
jgi:type VI secretion system protein ImpK